MDDTAAAVERTIRRRHPQLRIPYHSRWRHLEAGGIDRAAALTEAMTGCDTARLTRARIDLAVVSVLLDAGAGPDWRYVENPGEASGMRAPLVFGRSEGLAIASFHAFMSGAFSSDPNQPWQVDAGALQSIQASDLVPIFQLNTKNSLLGLEGRGELLRRLGGALSQSPKAFGIQARPGGLYDALTRSSSPTLAAGDILRALLDNTSQIWLTGNSLHGAPLGDVWRHPHAGGDGLSEGWVPFHKLSQWLTYSLFEPFEWAGIKVSDCDALTALPEYRNGGLLLDSGVLEPKQAEFSQRRWRPGDEFIVEWRALTVHFIDRVAERLQQRLGLDNKRLPLARALEGGTWATGRELAYRRRDGRPPLEIESDGTVF